MTPECEITYVDTHPERPQTIGKFFSTGEHAGSQCAYDAMKSHIVAVLRTEHGKRWVQGTARFKRLSTAEMCLQCMSDLRGLGVATFVFEDTE